MSCAFIFNLLLTAKFGDIGGTQIYRNMRKFLILLFLGVSFQPIMAEKTGSPDVYDENIIESVNKCVVDVVVNVTGGYIGLQETKDNGDKLTHIALPDGIGHYEITASLSSMMRDLEEYYSVVKPWKIVDDVLCSFHVDKYTKKKMLASRVYVCCALNSQFSIPNSQFFVLSLQLNSKFDNNGS